MPKGTIVAHLERPAEQVFAFVGDAANNPRWHANVVETTWLDEGPMRVGRRGHQVSRILGRRYEVDAEVVAWDPPRQVAWQTVAGDATVRTECRVDADGDGSRLTLTVEGEFTNPVLRLLSPLAIALMRRQADGDIKRLEAALALDDVPAG